MQNLRAGRRSFLMTAGGAVLAPALSGMPRLARAAAQCGSGVRVGTSAGDYQRLLHESVDPLLAPAGLMPAYSLGSVLAQQTKARAESGARAATLDVMVLRDRDLYPMSAGGGTADVDPQAIPNMANTLAALTRKYAVPHVYTAMVLVYDKDKFKSPPDSLAALADPALKGRIGLVDGMAGTLAVAGSLAAGKGASDMDAGRAYLTTLHTQGAKVYPSDATLGAALKAGDIWAALVWKSSALQWKKTGLTASYVVPKEGLLPTVFQAAVMAGSPNKQCASAYLNAMLDPAAQRAFAENLSYAPVIANAGLPPELQQAVGFSTAELDKLVPMDMDLLEKNSGALQEFWTKTFHA